MNASSFPPSLWTLFTTWFLLGIQSFGGGSSTFLLMHQAVVSRGWLSEDEFIRDWTLAQIAPGINLIKLTVLITHKLRGWKGILAGVAGMLLPSGLVTVLMTAGFDAIRSLAWVQSALRGVLPATIGLSIAMGVQMAQPLLKKAYREGGLRLGLHLAIIAAAGLFMALNLVSPVLSLLGAGAIAVLLFSLFPLKSTALDSPPGAQRPQKEGKH